MELGLTGKVALVTGASSGIGRATAALFASEKARVAIHYNTNKSDADQLAAQAGESALAVQADVTRESDVDRLFEQVVSHFGRVDVLVVNAGIWPAERIPIHEMSLSHWRRTLDVNLTGAFLCCRAFFRHLSIARPDNASMVVVGSTAGVFGEEGHVDYAASKAAVACGLTLSLKNEIVRLVPKGRVNCVCPGWTDTPMAQAAMEGGQAVQRALATSSLRSVATPEQIAGVIAFLASDVAAGHVTGATVPVSGGMEGRLLHAM